MSVTPRRPTSAAHAARNVTFSPIVDGTIESLEKRRRARDSPDLRHADPDNGVVHGKNGSVPSTTSHRTRLILGNSPARGRTPGAGALPVDEREKDSVCETTTTTLEFSLKDIPLDGKMAPPVWREPSRGRGSASRRASPARVGTPVSVRRSTPSHRNGVNDVDAPASPCLRNPYADLEWDSANLLRRQRVVRTFFESHEDAVRLYIRLQQLLGFRDVCQREFQQRLQRMSSDDERQAAAAARARRMSAQEHEIQRIQEALAQADVSSPEFSSSMNSLYSARSGTPPARSARRDEAEETRTGPHNGRDGAAAPGRAVQRLSDGPMAAESFGSPRADPRGKTHTSATKNGAAGRERQPPPPSSPRPSTPRDALEAWRRSRSLHPSNFAESLALEETGLTPSQRGYTSRDNGRSSNGAVPHAGGTAGIGALTPEAPDTKARQDTSPPPRQTAPVGITKNEEAPSSKSALRGDDRSRPPSSAIAAGTKNSTAAVKATATAEETSLLTTAPAATRSAAPRQSHGSVPAASTAQASTLTPQNAVTGLVTPPQTNTTKPHSTDSPLARFRRRQGNEDPLEHSRDRPPSNVTPPLPQPSLGSTSGPSVRNGGPRAATEPNPLSRAGERRKRGERVVVPSQDAVVTAKRESVGPDASLQLDPEKTATAPKDMATPARRLLGAASTARAGSGQTPHIVGGAKHTPVQSSATGNESQTPPTQPRSSLFIPDGPDKISPSTRLASAGDTAESRAPSAFKSAAAVGIQSWSPADPPMPNIDDNSNQNGVPSGLVSSARASQSPSAPQRRSPPGKENARSSPYSPARGPVEHAARTRPPADTSVNDALAALERRVGGLEGRTAELERNATKRAVLEAIRRLRERVTLLEERTSILERGDDVEPSSSHLQW
ncbi:hypothetical protein ABB37_05976 [Leptomonas pyrrhocoris]|uniref:Uncharacterized protein n=1 Tax=Leptomonas pyrrhocoris TaxID=157538 RepID=A0A0N0DUG5_LEPPY|nr:hypothetical protein ABB37_05976 [Leptomonas pyrrhocoris]KPA78912.1 hypothetical protein ABB37_05976 [Leptomonas pyrrhocoris]|eukprot:XP_015657351.1 hypothetical protein ABB37_05976 [Leptomonas pyrrhocoris]